MDSDGIPATGGVDGADRRASFAQARLWFLDQLRPGAPDYLLPMALRIGGPLDTGALAGALVAVTDRHEVLRTRYATVGGELVQRVQRSAGLAPEFHDLGGLGAAERERRTAELIDHHLRLPFDLTAAPPVRAAVLRLAADDHLLLVVVHHIAFDGLSWEVFGAELAARYSELTGAGPGDPATAAAPAFQYADFADWQREQLSGERLAARLDYWRTRLADLPPLELPTDRQRPDVWDGGGDVVRFEVPAATVTAVDALARGHRMTRFMVLLAVFQALLARSTGQSDFAVGTPVAGRGRAGADRLVGLFVNSTVLRADLSGDPAFTELLERTRRDCLADLSHADAPFELLVEELAPERELSRNPLFQVSFSLRNAPAKPIGLPGLDVDTVRTPLFGSPFDLVLDADVRPDGSLNARLQYATALFDRGTVQRLADGFRLLLDGVLADPGRPVSRIGLLTEEDRKVLVEEYNDTAVPVPARCLHDLLAEQAARTPGADAVRWSGGTLSYRELDRRANGLAHRLRAAGAGPETLVGVCLRRGPDLVVSLLAVLKAGAAYLPLTPDHPPLRRAAQLGSAGARLLITDDGAGPADWDGAVVAPAAEPADQAPPSAAGPDNLAYVLFTSGSTGAPKGVAITHRNLVNYVVWSARTYLSAGAGTPLYSPVTFDLPVTALYPALLTGAPVTLTPDDGTPGIDGLADALTRGSFDLVKLTPTHLGFLGRALTPEALRTGTPRLAAGGELLTGAMLAPWREHAPATLVFNEYGPTETTVGCATLVRRADAFDPTDVPLGVPIANTRMYVLDAGLRPVLPGAVGELYIGGAQVARGYYGRPALTAERFVPDPFSDVPGDRLYRSGDLVRHRGDGQVEFVARADDQLKVRGFRIEPGDVEAALAAHPLIAEAAVVAYGKGAAARLAAYAVARPGAEPDPDDVREHLGRLLPDYMVPSVFTVLPRMPYTDSGKVDRRALPDPAPARPGAVAGVAPRTPQERDVASVWADLLGLTEVGVHDDFFALGGNSLLAVQTAFRLRESGYEVALAEVFTSRTAARLAGRLARAGRGGRSPLVPVPHDRPLPLSFAQQRLWFLDRLAPGATDYLVPVALRLRGPLDRAALTAALDTVAGRHAVLRTRYSTSDGEPVQIVDAGARIPLTVCEGTQEEALRLVRDDLRRPFDLARDLPVRATLVAISAEDHLFLLTLHHIASDARSADVLADELSRAYAGREPLPAPPVQYADFAVWQRESADTPEALARLDHWCERLGGLPELELPTDRPRPRVRDQRGDHLGLDLPAELGQAVEEIARRHGATPFMVLLTAFYALLGRWTGQRDLAVGTTVSGRPLAETEQLLGFFANTLVLRGDLTGRPSFAALLGRVRDTALDAYAHDDVPFERIVERLAPQRDSSRNPLFQVMFELRPPAAAGFRMAGLSTERLAVSWPIAKFDLMLSVGRLADGGLRCAFEYATALWDPSTVRRMAEAYRRLLTAALADPAAPLDRLEVLDDAERRRLTAGWTDTAAPRPDRCLPELIAEQAARTPGATAVVAGDRTLTYAELDAAAARLARHLHTLGVRPETPVAVALRRDADLVTALLAVHRAGGVYVPIDPAHPARRRAHVLRDSRAAYLVTESAVLDGAVSDAVPGVTPVLLDVHRERVAACAADPLPPVDPAAGAYIVYTSGSTGAAKGVVISHAAIRNRVLWTIGEHGLGPADRVLQKTTVSFDAAMWEFLAPLASGGTVVVAGDGVPGDPAAMARAVAEHRVTVLQLVPSVLRALVPQPALAGCDALRLVFSAGEPLPAELCDRLLERVPVTLVNTYGPTECAIDVTSWRHPGRAADGAARAVPDGGPAGEHPPEHGEFVPIGHPLDNTRVLVLDPDGLLVPPGVPGELCVAGAGLARGYAGRGGLTADRFVPNPYPLHPGERLYRTGDRVRRRADGCLEYLGRLDRQVKLRGVRIEPSEIEAVLCEHPDVAAAAVGVYGDQRLVAHVVPAGDAPVDLDRLRAYLAERLPEPMMPSVLRPLAALPLTVNGKIDRDALPGLDDLPVRPYVAPRTRLETVTAAVFADVLALDRVGVHDDFFELGGHSLLVTRLVFRLAAALGTEVPVAEVFARRTVARLADLLADRPGDVPGAADGIGPVLPVPRAATLPPSSAQRRMWFLDQLEPGSAEYLVPLVLRLRGPLDVDPLRRALDDLVARHEVLRTRYTAPDGSPAQVVDPPGPLGTTVVDVSGRPPARAAEEAMDLVRAETARPFALDTQWPLRALLVRVRADEHLLALTLHHIAVDGWSADLLVRDLGLLHRSRVEGTPPPPLPPVQYADFAAWQQRWAEGPGLAADLAHWTGRLTGLTPLELPTDRPHPAVRDPRGSLLSVEVPAALGDAVTALARRCAVTPYVVLLAAFHLLLARYSGQDDVAVGAPVAGRTRPEVEDVVGSFVNTVVLRADLGGDPTFLTLVDRVRQEVVAAYSHQDLPFERLVDELQPVRDLARNPLFQVMFDFQHSPAEPLRLDGIDAERVPAPWHTAKFDLTLSLGRRADGGLRGLFEYADALFDRSTVERMAGHYLELLRGAVRAPGTRLSALPLLTAAERHRVLHAWNPEPGHTGRPAASVPELFAARAAAHPAAEAVSYGKDSITYAELNARANRLAHHLGALGVERGRLIAVCMERGPEAVVALLAVLKSGAAYVPVDPGHPAERLEFMLRDADVCAVVTQDRFAERLAAAPCPVVRVDGDAGLIARRPAADPSHRPAPDDLAYMIYTSGSTGRPKGVLIEHGSYSHHCAVIADSYGIGPDDRVVLLSALTFDVAMDQIAATLLAGATVVVAEPVFWSPAELPDRVAEHGITVMEITPAYYREVMGHVAPGDRRLRGLRLMNVGSDVVTVDDARGWLTTGLPGRFLCNYGPTEATVTCVLHPVPADPGGRGEAALPIGRPVPGTRGYVLDRTGSPVPVGVPGELHLGGVRLARGYHRRPALTAEKFVPDPFGAVPGGRLYRTGDLVRHRPDGSIEFLGRIDQQVKVRGFRIELGEIEAVLARHPGIRAVAVAARDLRPGDRQLVAYLVAHDGAGPQPAELRAYAGEHLPDYMVPALWVPLPALPLTPSKKVDRKALPAPDPAAADRPYTAPRNPTEEILAGTWAEVLGIERIGVHDDVFLLGAHSLLVTRVMARLPALFGVSVGLRRLFEATTVAALADVVREAVEAEIDRMSDDEIAELLAREGGR